MFDPTRLREIHELHEKSFALLKWVRGALNQGRESFFIVHQNTDSASAAAEWIQRNRCNFPVEARPHTDQIAVFSKLFVSFLRTSYQLKSNAVRMESSCGCWCSYCAYLRAGPNLQVRNPSPKDKNIAKQLKRFYLESMADELGIPLIDDRVGAIMAMGEHAEDISIATWGAELLRRSEFASQGQAVLALWREFAWHHNKPRQNFKLTDSRIFEAEQAIVTAMNLS